MLGAFALPRRPGQQAVRVKGVVHAATATRRKRKAHLGAALAYGFASAAACIAVADGLKVHQTSWTLDTALPSNANLTAGASYFMTTSGLDDALPSGNAPLKSPGQLASHYAPSVPVRLGATAVAADEGLLAFGPSPPPGARATLNLSPTGDLAEAAANLFTHLRALDAQRPSRIAVMPIPGAGLGLAINDRLRRAAADDGSERRG